MVIHTTVMPHKSMVNKRKKADAWRTECKETKDRQRSRKWTIKLILHTMNLFCYHKTYMMRSFVHLLASFTRSIAHKSLNMQSICQQQWRRHNTFLDDFLDDSTDFTNEIYLSVSFFHRLSRPWMWVWVQETLDLIYTNKHLRKQKRRK